MNHKQEAQRLVDLFYNLFKVELENSISKEEAKQCAIICCDEILKSNPTEPNDGGKYWGKQAKEYYQKTKEEINLLQVNHD